MVLSVLQSQLFVSQKKESHFSKSTHVCQSCQVRASKKRRSQFCNLSYFFICFFSFKESLKWIWSEIQIFDQFATFPLIFVYTSVIHLYCSHCAIQLFRSNCTIVSSGLFTGICCKKLSPTFLFRWPAKNWRQEHRLFDTGFLGIWRLGLPCSKMASRESRDASSASFL